MDDSDSSSLSSAPEEEIKKLAPIFLKAKKATKAAAPPPKASPARPKREPSPPHEEVLADNPDIAFIVMFRSRFHAALPTKLAHFGPQDIERGVVDTRPSPQVEALLCALLGLVLNRKKPVEAGHYGRALEEAIHSHKSQWPLRWKGINPLHGPRDFNIMPPEERIYLLRTFIMWSMNSSDVISTMIKDSYKQSRHMDDENQPLSVQPWGKDGDRRRYFLIEGQDDTTFRIYREGHRYNKQPHWWSMAGEIDEIRRLADSLEKEDGSQAARTLSQRMLNAIPRFEATEEKRRRREYRQIRRAAFTRPEPGYSLYEGRTRGKRMRYNFDDDDDDDDGFLSEGDSTRRSTRQSQRTSPFESGPVTTLSGRQVKPRRGGEYGASLLSGQAAGSGVDEGEQGEGTKDGVPVRAGGRSTRAAGRPAINGGSNPRKRKFTNDYNPIDDLSEEEDAAPSGDEWDSDANEGVDPDMPDADDEDNEMDEDEGEDEVGAETKPQSLVVTLQVSPKTASRVPTPFANGTPLPSGSAMIEDSILEEPGKKEPKRPGEAANGFADPAPPTTDSAPPKAGLQHAQIPLSENPTATSISPTLQRSELGPAAPAAISTMLAPNGIEQPIDDTNQYQPSQYHSVAASNQA